MKQYFLAVLCVALFGCEPQYNGTEEKPNENWTNWPRSQLVSIVNDSLAVLKICKYKKNTWYDWGFEGSRENYEITDSHTGVFLVNYRNKQKPLLGDTLSYDLIVVNEYYRDSSVLVFDKKNSQFGFWKIGAKSIEFKKYSNSIDCNLYVDSYGDVSFIARPWVNGNILLKPNSKGGSNNCSRSILNTGTGQIEPFEISGEYEWLSRCIDMAYIGNKITCIRRNEAADNFELVVEGMVADTLVYEYSRWHGISNWYGNYVKDNRYGTGYLGCGKGEISKIDTLNFKFDDVFASIRVRNEGTDSDYLHQHYSIFQDDNNFTVYEAEDLVGKKLP